ncbi:DNA binding [Ascochyta rabiei]|uniref:DNA binding n=2 Tax=Didymella rabiei TaxID=5454 RepID=A0A163AI78_DIDRA|nr:DNA binding [Ascochyta rabiei]
MSGAGSPGRPTCAGICELSKDPSTNHFTRIRLKLSTPLLQYRPRSDIINTLLHEAIHAYFFITTSWKHSRGDDGTGHGAGFQLLADAINNHGNYEVTIYHTFHDEVDSYRTHVWQCNGPCKSQPPFFGQVKRSMNRPPGKGDTWWSRHDAECGGTYTKISEPKLTKKQLQNLSSKERAGRQKNKLDDWVMTSKGKDASTEGETSDKLVALDKGDETPSKVVVGDVVKSSISSAGQKRSRADANGEEGDDDVLVVEKKTLVECPICAMQVANTQINKHFDVLH